MLGASQSIFKSRWPSADPWALVESTVTLAVQVNGKLRGQLTVAADLDEQAVVSLAKADSRVSRFLGEAPVIKTIFVPGRLLNLVVRGKAEG